MQTTRDSTFTLVAAVDGSELAETVLEHALDAANRHAASKIHILRVVDTRGLFHRGDPNTRVDAAHEALSTLLAEKLPAFYRGNGEHDVSIQVHVRAGVPAEEIIGLAAECEADLIMLGRHGEAKRHRFLVGSVPERVLRVASCTVSVVQPTDYGEHETIAEPLCPACIAIRRESDGDLWFCEKHREDRIWKTTRVGSLGGGSLKSGPFA